tara:strand:+ start:145 stop:258 length:114 start_codon:yes stop_codon:yes gene_type:complete
LVWDYAFGDVGVYKALPKEVIFIGAGLGEGGSDPKIG